MPYFIIKSMCSSLILTPGCHEIIQIQQRQNYSTVLSAFMGPKKKKGGIGASRTNMPLAEFWTQCSQMTSNAVPWMKVIRFLHRPSNQKPHVSFPRNNRSLFVCCLGLVLRWLLTQWHRPHLKPVWASSTVCERARRFFHTTSCQDENVLDGLINAMSSSCPEVIYSQD